MTSAPPSPAPVPEPPARRWSRSGSRRSRTLDVVVGGRGGPRSPVWTVTVPRSGPFDVVVTRGEPGLSRIVYRAGRVLQLPVEPVPVPAPPLGAAGRSPAPGWHVGAVIVVGVPALCAPAHDPVPDGTRRVVAPPPGLHAQIVLLLGDEGCAPLELPSAQDAGSLLLPGRERIQLWSHHVPNGPRRPRGAESPDGVPVVVDTGCEPGPPT